MENKVWALGFGVRGGWQRRTELREETKLRNCFWFYERYQADPAAEAIPTVSSEDVGV